ncbi:glycerophosphodiester phosphodiesterase [Nocardioides sp.]|uniref:glycerophosphodiester phosphodiesterase n=1 Tax=Nocardioides sp. TaxID=35761 RepID=UPI002B89C455|nr:glycerophosphodiester phosphodiesterase [Nocardioides sp.]HXH77041.1 glycerophosphodiester phosphodiesterase [Nocardioides sp.]
MTTRRSTGTALAAALALSATLSVTLPAGAALAAVPTHDQGHAQGHARVPAQGQGHADDPVVIGHRGASGYRPEHTLAAYELAIEQGATYIEPDVVSTKDGVLVARHENEISGTTDVAEHPEFAARRTSKVIDGTTFTGWFTEDFTYAELSTLRAKERLPQVRPQNTAYDRQFAIPTLDQVLDLAVRAGVGVYPETKHPTYFDSIGLSLEEPLVAALEAHDLDDKKDAVIVQSFEVGNLQDLNRMTKVDLAQLVSSSGGPADLPGVTYASMVTPAGLKAISKYADGLGANKDLILPRTNGATTAPSNVVRDAHKVNLVVHVWTLRRENQFMATNFRVGTNPTAPGDMYAETLAFLDAGVDGVFSDNPDIASAALADWLARSAA